MRQLYLLNAICFLFAGIEAFQTSTARPLLATSRGLDTQAQSATLLFLAEASIDDNEIIAKRIIVKGDVQGGYYRSCVRNEAARFRQLVGTMTPPDDSDEAEIYVEGKRKVVDGFIRWCKRGSVGLSQVVLVSKVDEEDPTGLYDGFYVKTK